MFDEPLIVLRRLVEVFTACRIEYCVGGSFAGSVHGVPRATQDVDLVALVTARHVPTLVEALQSDFYISDTAANEAIAAGGSFNVIHFEYAFKADIFVPGETEWTRTQLDRAISMDFDSSAGPVSLRVASAEDCVLAKLRWYRMLNDASEQQWRDILGIMRVSGATMDAGHMTVWARRLGVADLLGRVQRELWSTPM
jgi:hypothetical protein